MKEIKIYYIENLGCAKNQVDAELMAASLSSGGYIRKDGPEDADLIIVNTCGFIEPAREESVNTLLAMKETYPAAVIVSAGCLAQRYPHQLADSMPELGGVFGNMVPARIAEYVKGLSGAEEERVVVPVLGDLTEAREKAQEDLLVNREFLMSMPGTAYVKISEGCSNHCSFCAIPVIRGEMRSRSLENIVREIEKLVSGGSGRSIL